MSVFRPRAGGAPELLERVVHHLSGRGPAAVLEIGCGSGELARAIAARLPDARVLGVDLDPANVALANEAPVPGNVAFHAGDYLALELGTFDAIVAGSTLHLIAAPTERLVAKLARDLARGGVLVATLPRACAYNRALYAVRRVLRHARGPALDALVLRAGRALHPEEPAQRLLERLPYAYAIPAREDGRALRRSLAAVGLELIEARPHPHASLAQPRHGLTVHRRT